MAGNIFPTCFAPQEVDQFRDWFESSLVEIAGERSKADDAYPASVEALLKHVTTPRQAPGRPGVRRDDLKTEPVACPVRLWVADRGRRYAATLDRAWERSLRKSKHDLSGVSQETLQLMSLERAWRFWGLVALAGYALFSPKASLSTPRTIAAAAAEFVVGGSKTQNALSALLADSRFVRALTPQELPLLEILHEALPGLIETFTNIDVGELYPFRNMRADAKDKAWATDVAEIAIRNLGHCDGGILADLLSAPDLPSSAYEEKWYSEQSSRAASMVKDYEERRYVLDVRLPRQWQEDPFRPGPRFSPWLAGTWGSSVAKGTVNRAF